MKIVFPLICALGFLLSPASAEILYGVTFEPPIHEVGQPPSVGERPSKVSEINTGSPRVVNDQPLLDGNSLEFEAYASYAASESVILNTANTRGVTTIDYDFVPINLAGSSYAFGLWISTPDKGAGLSFRGGTNDVEAFTPYPWEVIQTFTALQTFENNRKYHVSIAIDTYAGIWTISIDGIERYRAAFEGVSVDAIRFWLTKNQSEASDDPSVKTYLDNFTVTNTRSLPPLIKDVEALSVGSQTALLTALVYPQHSETRGTVSLIAPNGTTISTQFYLVPASERYSLVSIPVDNLQANQKYGFKVTATNGIGTTAEESEFTTSDSRPVAIGDSFHTVSDTEAFTLNVKSNDSDPGASATIRLPGRNEAGFNPNVSTDGQTITFRARSPFDGNAHFHYILTERGGDVSKAVVRLTNSTPVAPPTTILVNSLKDPVTINTSPLVSDADGDPLTITKLYSPVYGNVGLQSGNQIAYHPKDAFLGHDQITYEVSDGRGGKAIGTIFVRLEQLQKKLLTYAVRPSRAGVPRSFGVPSLFPDGAGWLATVFERSGPYQGIFIGDFGSPVIHLQTGRIAPLDGWLAGSSDAVFSHLDDPVFAGPTYAFRGRVNVKGRGVEKQNRSGIWVAPFDRLRAVALEGDTAPGSGGARFRQFQSMALPNDSTLFFTALLQTGSHGVTTKSDRGLWVWNYTTDTVQRALVEGQFIEVGGRLSRLVSFRVLSSVPGSTGHGRYDVSRGSVDALLNFEGGQSAIATIAAEGPTIVAQTGDDSIGVTLARCGMPASPGEGKRPVALVDFFEAGDTTKLKRGIMDFESYSMCAVAGSPAAGTESETFLDFKDPVTATKDDPFYSLQTMVAFEASLAGGSKKTNAGIWWIVGSNELQLVARKGMPAPGTEDEVFSKFHSLSIIDEYGPLFTASLSPGKGSGCWATNSKGELVSLLRTGEVIDGRKVRSFDVLSSVRGSEGQRRAWGNIRGTGIPSQRVIFRARFTDGTSGILLVILP